MSESNVTIDDLLVHAGWLRALALRLVGNSGADDLVQEVWLRAARRPPSRADSPRGWLKSVLRSVHVRQLERQFASRDREREVAPSEGLPSTTELLGRAEAQRCLVESVVALDEPYRRTLLLHYFEGHSAAEIARQNGEPSSTVRNRLARGVDRLRESLDARPGGRASWISGLALLVPPDVGLASLNPISLGSIVMWKFTASAVAVAVIGWLGASVLLSEPGSRPLSQADTVTAAGDPALRLNESDDAALEPLDQEPERMAAANSLTRPDALSGAYGLVVGTDGRPLVGVTVVGLANQKATTDQNGVFSFSMPDAKLGECLLSVTAPGYVVQESLVKPARHASGFDLGTITLDRAAELSGVVIDAEGQPVGDVELRLESTNAGPLTTAFAEPVGDPAVVTASNGAFTLSKLAVGPWRIRADHPAHPTTRLEGVARRPGVQPGPLELQMLAGGSLNGRVLGQIPGDGVRVVAVRKGAGVEANRSRSVIPDPDGSFHLRGLIVDAEYEVVLADATDILARGSARSNRVTARPGDGPIELVINGSSTAPTAGAGLRFRIVDARTSRSIPRCEVSYRDGAQGFPRSITQGVADTVGGSCSFESLPAARVRAGAALRIEAPGYEFYELGGIAMTVGQWTDLGDIRLRPAQRIRVRVLDDSTSKPVANARVALAGYPLRSLAPATLRAQECASCHGGSNGDVTPEGNPVTPGTCYPLYQQKVYSPFDWTAATDSSGEATIELGSDVPVTASITHPDHVGVELERTRYAAGEVLEVRLPGGGSITAQVLEIDGTPVVGATVTCEDGQSQVTDADGQARFARVAAGTRELVASRRPQPAQMVVIGGAAPPTSGTRKRVSVRAGEASTVLLRLEAASSVVGIVTERGQPLAGATVRLRRDSPRQGQAIMFGSASQALNSARTRSDGSFEIEDVEPGNYDLVIAHANRAMDDSMQLTVTPGATRADADLELAAVQGTVVDDAGSPVAGARVSIITAVGNDRAGQATMMTMQTVSSDGTVVSTTSSRGASSVRTDRNGRFELRGVRSGVALELTARGRKGLSGRATLDPLGSNEFRSGFLIETVARGTLKFQVSLRGGLTEAFPRATLQRMVDGLPIGEEREVSGGPAVAVIDDLEPGTYSVRGVLQDGSRTEAETITIQAGKTVTRTFSP